MHTEEILLDSKKKDKYFMKIDGKVFGKINIEFQHNTAESVTHLTNIHKALHNPLTKFVS